jgi:transposase
VKQQNLFDPVPRSRLEMFSKEELIEFYEVQQRVVDTIIKDNERLRGLNQELEQKSFLIEEQFVTIKNKLFGKSSERSSRRSSDRDNSNKNKKKKVLLPSERYPNAPLIEKHIILDQLPSCKCCGSEMPDSGMIEESQYLTKIPAQYYVVVQVRHKYACRKCHGDIQTAPALPRIKEGSSYSDEMIIDVAVSKYCDLIPIDRQAQMAGREGIKGLPPQSLIEGTHNLADFVGATYARLKTEMLASSVWHADETPHRMLEGDKTTNWFLWGFSNKQTSYFECHDTRSGDVASSLLIESKCQHLVSDVFSGYSKAVKKTNKIRIEKHLPIILHVYCNAHARRYFRQASEKFPEESQFYINQYRKIYRLEGLAQKNPDKKHKIRNRQLKYFEKIRDKCLQDVGGYSDKSKLGKAMNYFLKNYVGFTRFIDNPDLPIDNNPAERLLRNPVIGRKTWYGTHSKRGAETASILFSLVESCKLNQINPREYFKKLVQDLHQGKSAYTPKEYKDLQKN